MIATDPYLAAARLALDRAKAEIELVASIADSPRRSLIIVRSMGIAFEHFQEPDTAALFFAIEQAVESLEPIDRERLMTACRRCLKAVQCWDENDRRQYVARSSRWSHGSLAALLCRVKFDPELVKLAATRFKAFDRGQA